MGVGGGACCREGRRDEGPGAGGAKGRGLSPSPNPGNSCPPLSPPALASSLETKFISLPVYPEIGLQGHRHGSGMGAGWTWPVWVHQGHRVCLLVQGLQVEEGQFGGRGHVGTRPLPGGG